MPYKAVPYTASMITLVDDMDNFGNPRAENGEKHLVVVVM